MKFSIDWDRLQVPEPVRRRLSSHSLQSIQGIHRFDASVAIRGLNVPVHVVSCYSDSSRVLCERWRDGILLLHNSYLTSFIQHVGLAALAAQNFATEIAGHSARDMIYSLGKKLVAEQMHVLAPSRIARVLFLETVIAHEAGWRRLVELKAAHSRLDRSVTFLARLISDFLMHHELGHAAVVDQRFDQFTKAFVENHLSQADLGDFSEAEVAWLTEEATADVFSLNCCLARYAPTASGETLRSYLVFLARSVTVMNLLYAFAADMHRLNVDESFDGVNVGRELMAWAHRESVMVAYLEAFDFEPETVVAREDDDLLPLRFDDECFSALWHGQELIQPPSENVRLLAEVISQGFEMNDFAQVIAGFRAPWVLGADDVPPGTASV